MNDSDESDLQQDAAPIAERKRSGLQRALAFFVFLLLLLAVLCRNSIAVHQEVAVFLLKMESEIGSPLLVLKKFFGIRLALSADVAAEQIALGDLRSLNSLLRGGLDANARTSAGDPLLIVAVTSGRLEGVAKLLDFGADVNAAPSDGNSAILLATQMGNIALVNMLATAGADLNHQNALGETALLLAVKSENMSLAQQLLNAGVNVNLKDKKRSSPLALAAEQGNETLVVALLKQGANPAGLELIDKDLLERINKTTSSGQPQLPLPVKISSEDLEIPSADEQNTEPRAEETVAIPATEILSPSTTLRTASAMTRLRVIGAPIGTWTRRKQVTLDSVELTVKNVGSYEAQDVTAKIVVPGGEVIDLNGPTTMKANSQAKFSAQPATTVTKSGSLSPKVFCSNCRS